MKAVTSYKKGVIAEQEAAAYLKRKGYKVLKSRYRTKFGEIDLIVRKKKLIAFVEVKAHKAIEDSYYAVTLKTRRRIEQSALWFLSEYPEYSDFDMRFDVLAFGQDPQTGEQSIQYLDNAWMVGA